MPQAQQQTSFNIGQLLSDPNLSYFEKQRFLNSYEERMGIETETRRVQLEQQKLLHKGEKLKQSLLARAIESMTPGWERGGQRVDIGGFGRGGAPMEQVAVGPGPIGREITPAIGPEVQYRQPGVEQQRMGQQLVRREMGLTPEDPMDVFDRQMKKIAEQEALRGEREEARDIAAGQRAEKREEKITGRLEIREAAQAAAAEKKETAQLAKAMKLKFEDILTGVHKEYTKQKNVVEADLTKTSEYRNAALEDLKDSYMATIGIVAKRAAKHGLDLDVEEFGVQRDPSTPTRRQLDQYKKATKQQKKIINKLYKERFGKPFPLEEE